MSGSLPITQEEFDALRDYSRSLPTFGVANGRLVGCRRWKRRTADGWLIGQASFERGSGMVKIEWSTPEIVGGAA
jgi:hypothetical protein